MYDLPHTGFGAAVLTVVAVTLAAAGAVAKLARRLVR
jgi:LPXTG-motif cell wall-anchored protein